MKWIIGNMDNLQVYVSICTSDCLSGVLLPLLTAHWPMVAACPAHHHASNLPQVCYIINGPLYAP